MSAISDALHAFVLDDFSHDFGAPSLVVREDDEWKKVWEAGSELWLDTGDMNAASDLWNTAFRALTTNNTLLNKEIQKGLYDALAVQAAAVIKEAAPDISDEELVLEVAFALNAYHGLRLVETFDAHVSVELHTDLAGDVSRTVDYGERFFAICPQRFIVKVPLTPAGLLGARTLVDVGVPINFTLGFSARQNYVAALLAQPTYLNVFLGRLNAFVADAGLGDGKNVGEKTVLAAQRAVRALREDGRSPSRLIGASIRSGAQIADITGVDVLTMPPAAAAEYREHPPARPASQMGRDPDVELADGVRLNDFNGQSLWDIPDDLKASTEAILTRDVKSLTPDTVQTHFADAGHADLFPAWTDADIARVATDGKIPDYTHWKDRLAAAEIGLDALMNLSALQSFTSDQRALDDRIRGLLQIPAA